MAKVSTLRFLPVLETSAAYAGVVRSVYNEDAIADIRRCAGVEVGS